MYDKILAQVKAKFKDKGLSEKVLVAIARRIEASGLTDENQIEAAVTAEETVVAEFQSFADSRFEAGKKTNQPQPAPAPKPEGDPAPSPQPADEAPAWAKGFIETTKQLAERLSAIEQGKSTETRSARLQAIIDGTTEAYKTMKQKEFERIAGTFKDDAAFDQYLTDVTEEAKGFAKEDNAHRSFQPMRGGGGGNGKQASKEEVDAVVNAI